MIGKLAKAVLKIIMPDVVEHLMQVFKLDKLVNYMELPNDADKKVKAVETQVEMLKDELKDANKSIKDISETFKKLKNKKTFKKFVQ